MVFLKGILKGVWGLGTVHSPKKGGPGAKHHRYESLWISKKTYIADRNAHPNTYSVWNDFDEHI